MALKLVFNPITAQFDLVQDVSGLVKLDQTTPQTITATDTTITATDEVYFGDVSDSSKLKKDTVQGILDLTPAPDLSTLVPYTGATGAVDLGAQNLTTTGEITGEIAKVQASEPTQQVGNLWLDPNTNPPNTAHSTLTQLDYETSGHTGFEPAKGSDDNFVTDAEKTKLSNLSGTNTGDQNDHSEMDNLAYASSGHTGFEPTITAGTSAQFLKGDKSLGTTPMDLIETASPSAASSFTFSNLVSGAKYYLVLTLTQNTTGAYISVRFNADTGNNYAAQMFGGSTTNTISWDQSANSGQSLIYVAYGYAGDSISSAFHFSSASSNANNVLLHGSASRYRTSAAAFATMFFGGLYTGSAAISSITVLCGAGTMTGTAKLYRLN